MGGYGRHFNLLVDRVIRIKVDGRNERVALPELYAALMADCVSSVTALRPHQKHALHAFLVQVGALALLAAGKADPPASAEEWLRLLRGLTGKAEYKDDEPWSLVVEDLSKPALLQPPVPEGTLDALKETEITPDALDMLITSKNHDLKAQRMSSAEPEDWFLALLTLQTCEGFLGAGNYGISRMNGGFASRPSVGLAPKGGWGSRVKRDIERLIACRDEILDDNPFYSRSGGIGLVWLEPWDGTTQLSPRALDPFYVEICRRVRLVKNGNKLFARRGPTKTARIAFPKQSNGVTGDPWTPTDQRSTKTKALTIDGSGFHYVRVAALLDPVKFRPAPLQTWSSDDGRAGIHLEMIATARGQGETQGHHERRIPIPSPVVSFFGKGAGDRLAMLARERVEQAGRMRRKVLRPALFCLLQGAPEEINYNHAASETKSMPFLAAFDHEIDSQFFDALFDELAEPEGSAAARAKRREWLLHLKDLADGTLATAEAGSPLSHVRRYKTRAAAQRVLDGAFHRVFGNMLGDPE